MSWILFSGRFMEGKKSMERVYNVDWIKDSITGNLERSFGCTLDEATEEQIYQAVALTVRDQIMDKFVESRHLRHAEKSRRVYYLSVEFLMGRALHNNILNLVRTDDYKRALSDLNISFDAIAEQEPDPGLGNGGLGRLAACFLDSWRRWICPRWAAPSAMNTACSARRLWTVSRSSCRTIGWATATCGKYP